MVAEVRGSDSRVVVLATLIISSYCVEQGHDDSDDALRDADTPEFKTFFQWLVDNAKREPQQTVTLKQYFRVLKMRYKDLTGNDLGREQVIDVNNVSHCVRLAASESY